METLSSQFSFHKTVEITVEHRLDVSGFVLRSVIFHKLVRRLDVTADL